MKTMETPTTPQPSRFMYVVQELNKGDDGWLNTNRGSDDRGKASREMYALASERKKARDFKLMRVARTLLKANNKTEMQDVIVLFPNDTKPTVVDRVEVELCWDLVFNGWNLTEESARKLETIRIKALTNEPT